MSKSANPSRRTFLATAAAGAALAAPWIVPAKSLGLGAIAEPALAHLLVMMAESTVITLSILTWLVLRWASRDTERQELLDLAAARGVELDPARAERAVSAGQGERLRERIESTAAHSEASGPA